MTKIYIILLFYCVQSYVYPQGRGDIALVVIDPLRNGRQVTHDVNTAGIHRLVHNTHIYPFNVRSFPIQAEWGVAPNAYSVTNGFNITVSCRFTPSQMHANTVNYIELTGNSLINQVRGNSQNNYTASATFVARGRHSSLLYRSGGKPLDVSFDYNISQLANSTHTNSIGTWAAWPTAVVPGFTVSAITNSPTSGAASGRIRIWNPPQQQAQAQQQAQTQQTPRPTQQQWSILTKRPGTPILRGRGVTKTLHTRFNPKTGQVEVTKNGIFSQGGFLKTNGGSGISKRLMLRGYR